jgi:NAD(P)-dependent dehydrogenase (short-subunit alcohol dehydrogenase family)
VPPWTSSWADALEAAAARVARHGTSVLVRPADTTDDATVRAMVAEVVAAFGGVDVLVTAAARPAGAAPVPAPAPADLTDDALRVEVETKVLFYLRCARAVAPHMAATGWGRIVNVSGLNAQISGSLVGSVRNVAVAARTKNLADELARPASRHRPPARRSPSGRRRCGPRRAEADRARRCPRRGGRPPAGRGHQHRPAGHRRGGGRRHHPPGLAAQRGHHR